MRADKRPADIRPHRLEVRGHDLRVAGLPPVPGRQAALLSRAKVTEVNASHAVFVSQPAAVVRVIEAAAK